ncbi:uncharacterized protein [Haliotis cracherodii]|uniref:uncharacterized protein isoform X2 n=1 Tax=Haliotis cracherodii TaxID=6455 RepID=UPI0039EB91C6
MSDPLSPKSPRKGKHVNLRVQFLDDTVHAFPIPVKSLGITLWEAVCQHLQLLEADYFDLEYIDNGGLKCWVDRQKPLLKQLPTPDTPLSFCTKFYTPDPGLLEDDFTRYLFALQIKQDLLSGVMPCSDNTAALLASYIAQAEIGDFLVDDYLDHTYLSSMKFVPSQTPDLEEKIMEYHKQHIGESPAEADLNLLDTARKVELYGIKMFPAKDHEAVTLTLAVAHMGVQVFQNATKINTFSWAKIRKLSFKRKKFLIKLHPESYVSKGYYKDTVEFFFDSRNECKGFWKKCIEHHGFFRCQAVRKVPRNKTRVVSRGSSFRYSGRTQKQLMEFVRGNIDKRQQFERSASGRISSRSTSVTPKITLKTNTHNSSDLHNSTASSGSHTLDITQDNHVSPMSRVETAEVHSDSSMSGSRSLGSPKLEHIPVGEATAAAMMRKEDSVDSRTEADDRGADSDLDKLKQNIIINNIAMQNEPSANQNANDNDDNTSQDSYHLEGEERVGKGREPGGKSVTFSPEDSPKLKSVNDTNVINNASASEKSTNHIDRLAESQAADRPDLAKLNTTNLYPKVNGEIPPSACITASVYGREAESPQGEGRKDVIGDNIVSASLKPDVDSFTDKRKYSADTDLIVDIPYTLHRRLKGESENKEETAFFKSPEGASTKESRPRDKSPGRPPTDSEPLQAVDIPLSPPLKHNTIGKSSSLERSPSTLRRFELVSCHKLPSRTSYSSVDDTTSPSFEKEILKQLEDKMQDDETVPKADEQCKTDIIGEGAPVPLPKAVPETSVAEAVNGQTSVAEAVNVKTSVAEPVNGKTSVAEPVNGKTNASESVNGRHSVEKCEMTSIVSSKPASDKSVSESGAYVSVEVRKPQAVGAPLGKPAKPPREKRPEVAPDPKRASSSSTSSESSAISSTKEPAHIAIDSKISVPASQTLDSKSPMPAPPSPVLKDASPTSSEESSNINTFGVPRTAAFGTDGPCMTENPQQFVLDGEKDPWFAVKPELKSTHMVAPNPQEEQKERLKVDSSGNPLIFDLPSPAAAFIYSDEDSPPSKKEDTSAALTFSTFRPEPGSDGQLDPSYIREKKEPIDSMKRRSLNRVEEEEEMTAEAITAVTAEPKPEPKRVSFHEDVDIGQSFHSDVSMMVMRSPVDDRDDSSFGGSCHGEGLDSGDILDTLENMCSHGSESDMTYSGSSGSESDTESDMDDTMAKEIYAQYAATKCLAESGKDMTIDSGVGELSEGTTHTREVSPLESLEHLDTMDGSFVADKDDDFKFPPPPPELQEPSDNSSSSAEIEMHPHRQKRYSIDPLATLERPDIADIEYTTSESESDFEEAPPAKKPPPPPVAAKPKPEFIKEKFGNESQT